LTELAFIVALEIGGFVLALTLARSAAEREPGAAVYRVVSAVERALRGFFAHQRLAIGVAVALALAVVIAAGALFGRATSALWVAAGMLFGAALCVTVAVLSVSVAGRAAGAAHASARLGFNPALGAALRAGGAAGIGAETASALGSLGLFCVTYFAGGGRATGPASFDDLVNPCLVTAGYALGAALAALVVERAGALYRVGAEAGRSTFDPVGDGNDPRNPALVSALVGDAGSVGSSSAVLFALTAVATSATFHAAKAFGAEPGDVIRAAALALIMRSFGTVGCAAGTLAARADEAQGQGLALLRGLACAFAIALFGIVGASYWLAPADFWCFASAGALGLGAAALPCAVLASLGDRRAKPLREVALLGEGETAGFGASVGHALERALAPLAAVVILTLVAGALGERGAPPRGAVLGTAVFALALSSLAPYTVTVLGLGAIAKSARSTMALSKLDNESSWRLQRLDDIGFAAQGPAHAHLVAASAFAGLPALSGVLVASSAFGLGVPAALALATLAALAVFASAGHAARAATRTAGEVALEVRRQVAGAEAGGEGHTPSYRACEELTQKAASAGLAPAAAWAIIPLALLGIGLGLVYRVGGSRLAAAALSTFVATAAVTALGAALAVDGARTVHGGARRQARLERETAGRAAPIPEDVLANTLGIAAGPAACSQALLLASLALAILELLR
jgi:Na+/H+-translocating membrane pyrophosphatase